MTCAPDAFNAGRYVHDTGLAIVAPGAELAASWTISMIEPIELTTVRRIVRAPAADTRARYRFPHKADPSSAFEPHLRRAARDIVIFDDVHARVP